jgi:predicted permease
VQAALRADGRGMGTVRDSLRAVLVVGEIALALTLLNGAGLLVRSGIWLSRTPVGFDPGGVAAARLALPASAYGDSARTERAFERIVNALRSEPGVIDAAVVSQAPMGAGNSSNGVLPEGRAVDARSSIDAYFRLVSPGYLRVMRIPVISGRSFNDQDLAGAPRVMIVSRTLAERAWPGQNPIGKRAACCEGSAQDPRWKTVIGVVGDVRSRGPTNELYPEFYLPMAQAPPASWGWIQRTMTLVVRSESDAGAPLTGVIQHAVRSVDPTIPIFGVTTMHQAIRTSTAEQRFNTMLLGVLALVGLALAAVGIASVVAFFVTARTHEIGVRLALGATSAEIVGLFGRQIMQPVILGVTIGIAGAAATSGLLRGSLYGVRAIDPLTGIAVVIVLVIVAAIATLVPARQATLVDPVRVLQ